jgi:hypothetical protein
MYCDHNIGFFDNDNREWGHLCPMDISLVIIISKHKINTIVYPITPFCHLCKQCRFISAGTFVPSDQGSKLFAFRFKIQILWYGCAG